MSRKKKAAMLSLGLLLVLAVIAAYLRDAWLLGPLLGVCAAAALVAMMRLDSLLKAARRGRSAAGRADTLPGEPRPGAVHWWAAMSKVPGSHLVQRLTKLRSLDGRDVLVSSITSGQWVWSDMAAALEMYRVSDQVQPTVHPVLDAASQYKLLLLADLCFRQDIAADDILNAATLYRYSRQRSGSVPFSNERRGEYFLDSLTRTGRGPEALDLLATFDPERLNANDVHLYKANATNPFKDGTMDREGWLRGINEIYGRAGLAQITLTDGPAAPFLRLGAEEPKPVDDGPLVSIVMPVFRPDAVTDLAIRSAINQSYRNIEIIIIDDGSGEKHAKNLKKWEFEDKRIRVVLNAANSGAYTSRNMGYSLAAGEFLTIFDGDDWQHPQKVELLVAAASRQGDNRLVSAAWSRVDEDMFFHYRGWRGAFITPAHVSTMFHTGTIRRHLGYWDSVRKAADTEFILRYQALVNPAEPLEVSEAPLTLSLVSNANLSIDDFRLGYRSPDRVSYRDSYEHWHKRIAAGAHNGYLDFLPAPRAFPAPARFLPVPAGAPTLDILLVGDFGSAGEASDLMFEHLRAATAAGQKIGVMHFPSVLHTEAIDRSFPAELMDEFFAGTLTRVEVTDSVESRLVSVYDPTSFQLSRELAGSHTADQVVVWAGEPSFDQVSGNHKYEMGTVERNLRAVFNGPVRWIPANGKVAEWAPEAPAAGSKASDIGRKT